MRASTHSTRLWRGWQAVPRTHVAGLAAGYLLGQMLLWLLAARAAALAQAVSPDPSFAASASPTPAHESTTSHVSPKNVAIVTLVYIPRGDSSFMDSVPANSEVSQTTRSQASEIASVSIPNKVHYSHKSLHPLFFLHDQKKAEQLLESLPAVHGKSPSPAWLKVKVIQEKLHHFPWVFWMDVDALFMNMNVSLVDIIKLGERKAREKGQVADMIITADLNGLNDGVFFIRSTPWAFRFLEEVWASYEEFADADTWEQAAMAALAEHPEHAQHIVFLPPRVMNSYPPPFALSQDPVSSRAADTSPPLSKSFRYNDFTYQKGDFVVHLAGSGAGDKLALARMYEDAAWYRHAAALRHEWVLALKPGPGVWSAG